MHGPNGTTAGPLTSTGNGKSCRLREKRRAGTLGPPFGKAEIHKEEDEKMSEVGSIPDIAA
jgi:hypothetical protein